MWKLKSKFSLFFAKKLQYKSNCQKLGEKNLDLGMKQEGHSSFSAAGTHFFQRHVITIRVFAFFKQSLLAIALL